MSIGSIASSNDLACGPVASCEIGPFRSTADTGASAPRNVVKQESHSSYTRESLAVKYRTADGDTFEMTAERETLDVSESWGPGGEADARGRDNAPADAAGEAAQASSQGPWLEVMRQVKTELKNQHIRLVQAMLGIDTDAANPLQGLWAKLANRDASNEGDSGLGGLNLGSDVGALRLSVEKLSLHIALNTNDDGQGLDALWRELTGEGRADPQAGEGAEAGADAEASGGTEEDFGVPEYWNAENTSNRIVNFALQFSSHFGEEAAGFIARMKDAIDLGFAQAARSSGPLEGNAKNLNEATHRMIFDKLDDKLAEWTATPYNQDSKQESAKKTVPAASGMPAGSVINLAA